MKIRPLYTLTAIFFCLMLPASQYAQHSVMAPGNNTLLEDPAAYLELEKLLPGREQAGGSYEGQIIAFRQVAACSEAILRLSQATLTIPADAIPAAHRFRFQYLPAAYLLQALPPEVENITLGKGSLRMSPSGIEHEGQLLLSIQVADHLQWSGSSAREIIGLAYHSKSGSWQQVALYHWDERQRTATFLTDPFSEFVAGIIKTPEQPTTASLIQTEIKDFQAPKPQTGITMIEPPRANNMGTANLSYPLQLPPGRNGLAPQLAISYNSGGGNSWLGLGWQLAVPTISVDTRWGVPRFYPDLETETYLYQGEQLYPVANRDDWEQREADKVFRPRIEGSFAKIIRHGDRPDEYWWEVIETNGMRKFFGGSGDKFDPAATLRDSKGHIAQWYLREQRDPNGNFIRYSYRQQNDKGPQDDQRQGYNRYLDRITYTGYGTEEGRFSVTFIRDQQLGEPRRIDAFIDGLYGFKKATASLLRRIEVQERGRLIRSYELTYQEGVFGKSLLNRIAHLDSEGKPFYSHDFSYFNDTQVDGQFRPLLPERKAAVPGDTLQGKLTSSVLGYQKETTLLGGNRANNFSLGIAVTVGPPGSSVLKKNSGGGHYTFTQTKGFGINSLLDINGDGLPDKVFVDDGHLVFRPNLGEINGKVSFGERKKIMSGSVDQFSTSRTRSHSYGGEVNVKAGGFSAYASTSKTKSKTTTPVYFQDFNADGLIDIAFNRRVYFNRLNDNGLPEFSATSAGTPNPIDKGVEIDDALADRQLEEDPDEPPFEEENPLHDAVKVWIVPYTGSQRDLRISGSVKLLRDESSEARSYASKDGVRVSIEHGGNTLFSMPIDTQQAGLKYFFNERIENFKKGDMIFFRVHSVYDGAYDQTAWDIKIDYLDEADGRVLTGFDANGNNLFSYHAAEDFLLVSPQELGMPMDGQIRIKGAYEVGRPLTDTLRLTVEKRYKLDEEDEKDQIEIVATQVIPPGTTASDLLEVAGVSIRQNDRIVFTAGSNSNIDWQAFRWEPLIEYNYSLDEDGAKTDLRDNSGEAILAVPASVNMQMFNNIERRDPGVRLIDSQDTTDVDVSVRFILKPSNAPPAPQYQHYRGEGKLHVSVKGPQTHYSSGSVCCQPLFLSNWSYETTIPHDRIDSDSLFIDIHFSDYEMYEHFQYNYLPVVRVNGDAVQSGYNIFTVLPKELRPIGVLHRNWGQFSYKAEDEAGDNPIDEKRVRHALADYEDVDFDYSSDDPDQMDESLDPTRKEVGIMYANVDSLLWQGYDNLLYVNDSIISSSRLGEDNRFIELTGQSGTGLTAPVKISRTRSKAESGSISFKIPLEKTDTLQPKATASTSSTSSWQHIDIIDMNADGYPDLIANGTTQFTNPRGGRTDQTIEHGYQSHYSSSDKSGITGGGSLQQASTPNTYENTKSVNFSSSSASLSQNFALGNQATIGVSGFVDRNEDETDSSWQDVNGDGLPDLVDAENKEIRLNYGYRFGGTENWSEVDIRKGTSVTRGASVDLSGVIPSTNKVNASWTLGVSLSKSQNHSTYGHQDVNGDGLSDILTVDEQGDLYVKLNLGQQYAKSILWKSDFLLDEGLSVSESLNGAFTICINFVFARICFNPKGYVGRSVSMPRTRIADVNGDGYPDFLYSSRDDNLTYALSTIGRTNMLESVQGPLGASMSMDYELLPSNYAQASGKWVLSSLAVHDGFKGDGADRQQYRYAYQDGWKDRREREFFGFARVITQELDTQDDDAVYRTRVADYANDTYYRKGLLLREYMEDAAGRRYTENTSVYQLRNPVTGAIEPDTYDEVGQCIFPALIRKVRQYYEGEADPGITQVLRYDYDDKGNVILLIDEGNGLPADQVRAEVSYHQLDAIGAYSIPERLEVKDHQGRRLRYRSCSVDGRGNITQIRQFWDNSQAAATDYEYDQYGNITKVTRPPNLHGDRLSYAFSYDDQVQTYVVQITDAYGYRSTSTYDLAYGLPLVTTDMNGQPMTRVYDDKGRLIRLQGPYERQSNQSYTIAMEYYPTDSSVPHALCRHWDPEHQTDMLTATFIDGLGRPVQVKKSGEVFVHKNQPDQEVFIVSGQIIYDAFGRETLSYYPITESRGDIRTLNRITPTEEQLRTTYDVLDRPQRKTLPDGAVTKYDYAITIAPGTGPAFQTITTDPLGNQIESYSDIRQRQLATVAYGPDPITTRFRYNAIGELLEVEDVAGNITINTYDLLGRQTSVRHPVSGLTELFYDAAGNLIRKLTANIREQIGKDAGILFDYEYERPVTITYPKHYQNNVRYSYGKAGDGFNRAGRIVLQEDAAGAQEFFYGPMGEITKTIRTVLINPSEIRTYVSEARYDTWNRIQEVHYPDGEIVSYGYNSAGKLVHMAGTRFGEDYAYVDRLSYDKFEKRRFLRYGNGTIQEYDYDPARQWLTRMRAESSAAGAFLDVSYTYDKVANVISMSNQAQPANSEIGGRYSASYAYDELYRLVEADGSWQRPGRLETYSLSMSYSPTHDILNKIQVRQRDDIPFQMGTYANDYRYDSDRPFLPSAIGETSYRYDDNGNLIESRNDKTLQVQEYQWDEENRLQSVLSNGYLSRYTYDAEGKRVIKSHGPIQGQAFNGSGNGFVSHTANYTAYVSPYLVARQGSYTKHYYIEGQRICSKIGQGQFNNNASDIGQGQLTAGGVDFNRRQRQIRRNALELLGEALVPYHPNMPFFYAQPEQTGVPYPNLFPDSIEVISPKGSYYLLPNPPDLSGNSQADHPAWGIEPLSGESVGAGYGMEDSLILPREVFQYFYHSDYLGSTAYVTNREGGISQFVTYTAFGELFVEGWSMELKEGQPYLFNGKELDRETGLYYYGARYYDPLASLWLSVDPMAHKYPGWSPYNFTMLNPVKLVDPDGRESKDPEDANWVELKKAGTAVKNLAKLAKEYLNPLTGEKWRSRYKAPRANMSKFKNLLRNMTPKLRKAGNQFLEAKADVMTRVKFYKGLSKSLGVISNISNAYEGFSSAFRGDTLGAYESVGNLSLPLVLSMAGRSGNAYVVGAAVSFGLSYSITRMADDHLQFSGKIADKAIEVFGPNTFGF